MDLHKIENPGSLRTLDKYILNYMRRRGLTTAAAIFAKESETTEESVEVDGLLEDWWAMFYGTYTSRPNFKPGEHTTSPIDPQAFKMQMNKQASAEKCQTSEINCPIMTPRASEQPSRNLSSDQKSNKGIN